jgi:hypothetical protein
MMAKLLLTSILLLVLGTPAQAHHSRANFDLKKSVSLSGVIKEWRWRLPHLYVIVETKDTNGNKSEVLLEGASLPSLRVLGWNKSSFSNGEFVKIKGAPDRNPNKRVVMFDYIEKQDGTRLWSRPMAYLKAVENGEVKKTAQAIIEPSTNFTGTWDRVFNAASPDLAGTFDKPKDYPLTEKGQSVFAGYHPNDNPMYKCIPFGVPRGVGYAYGLQIKREANDIIFVKETRTDDRVVDLSSKDHIGMPADFPRNIWGHPIGWMEGDTLVVDSLHYDNETWGIASGIDSGRQKKTVEHWRLIKDGQGLEAIITVTDPEYLTAPVTTYYQWVKIKDRELSREACELDQAQLFINAEKDFVDEMGE